MMDRKLGTRGRVKGEGTSMVVEDQLGIGAVRSMELVGCSRTASDLQSLTTAAPT